MDSNNQNEQVTKDLREQGIDQEEQGIDLSKDEIKDLIVKFNLDSSIEKLKEYYSTPTTWEIIGKSRSETCHTQFLAWFFGNSDFNANPNTGPIKKLIVLLLKWAKHQNVAFDENLENSIYSQSFKIINYEVNAEEDISDPAYGDGNIDIFIACTAKVNGKEKNINIVIENKINASETTKKRQGQTLNQTVAYKKYVDKEYENDINLFVYLKPTDSKLEDIEKAECACKEYIQINYQELLDNIIQPVCEMKDISEENRFRLKDYIKTLGTPSETETDDDTIDNSNKKIITIMAIGQDEKKLLKTFFYENEDLIRAAVKALDIKDLSEIMAKVASKKDYAKYELSYNGVVETDLAKANVAFAAIRMLRDSGMEPNQIEQVLKGTGKFWEKVVAGKAPTSGFTAEISFNNGEKYLVHTQRYDKKKFDKLVKVLRDSGFSCEQID